jgi:hypothetical protein
VKWAGHVVSIGRGETYAGFGWGKLRKKDHLKDPGVDGEYYYNKSSGCGGMVWIELAQGRDR